jgi:type IV secretion system protein VirB2
MRGRDLSCGHDETLSPHRFFLPGVVLPGMAHAQGFGADPAGSGPIVGALHWVQGTLMGTVATVAAVVAVACVGLMMLTGRMNWRYGMSVILGCFVLFGAASIVAGIQSVATGS